MLTFRFIFLLISIPVITACSSSKNLPVKTIFPFEYESESYQIVSISDPSGEGMNLLIKKDGDQAVLRTLDRDQNGVIDIIQYGSISLEEANFIYNYGIQMAVQEGKIKTGNSKRIFEHAINGITYTIQTIGLYRDVIYNEFTFRKGNYSTEEVYIDNDADGILDWIEQGYHDLEEVQVIYRSLIEKGLSQNQIEMIFEKYVVIATKRRNPA